jgi:hypothetical protein
MSSVKRLNRLELLFQQGQENDTGPWDSYHARLYQSIFLLSIIFIIDSIKANITEKSTTIDVSEQV